MYDGTGTAAEQAAESARLGGDGPYRMRLANALLGAVQVEAMLTETTATDTDELMAAYRRQLATAGVDDVEALAGFLVWRDEYAGQARSRRSTVALNACGGEAVEPATTVTMTDSPIGPIFVVSVRGTAPPKEAEMKVLVVAALALSVMASPAQAKDGCADARQEVSSIKGWVSPNACTFIDKQIRFGKVTTENRVQAYVDMWDANATLWEPGKAGVPLMQGLDAIRTSIAGSLALVPDFRFRGTRVAVNGPAVMFEAVNEATLKGHKITYPAVYRVLLTDGGKVVQGRRYYDRHLWFSPLDPSLPDLFGDVADSGLPEEGRRPVMGPEELAARAQAWNSEDAEALTAHLSGAPLSAPGLGERELKTGEGKRAYLTAFFDQVSDVKLQPGQTVRVHGATYVEWYGTVLPKGQSEPMSFGIIERIADKGGVSTQWQLSFDQLPLIADQDRINKLYGLLR